MLHKLTCNVEQSQQLITLGIVGVSFLTHYRRGTVWGVMATGDTDNFQEAWPAWTKAELDAMIGPDFPKPDLCNQADERVHGNRQDLHTYPIFTAEKGTFYKNGAVASAAGLVLLLEGKYTTAADANERYSKTFQFPKDDND